MLYTLFCAETELDGDVIISYSDIIYTPDVLRSLLAAQGDFCVIIDRQWEKLWRLRMENPLDDAESLVLDDSGNIIEIGRKTKEYAHIQGQYIGLFKISAAALAKVRALYHSMDKSLRYDGKDFENMYMTSFIQEIAKRLMPVKAVPIDGGWLEIDSIEDLNAYTEKGFYPSPFHEIA
jgi:choline kinase